jgi:hypothetical protein
MELLGMDTEEIEAEKNKRKGMKPLFRKNGLNIYFSVLSGEGKLGQTGKKYVKVRYFVELNT